MAFGITIRVEVPASKIRRYRVGRKLSQRLVPELESSVDLFIHSVQIGAVVDPNTRSLVIQLEDFPPS